MSLARFLMTGRQRWPAIPEPPLPPPGYSRRMRIQAITERLAPALVMSGVDPDEVPKLAARIAAEMVDEENGA